MIVTGFFYGIPGCHSQRGEMHRELQIGLANATGVMDRKEDVTVRFIADQMTTGLGQTIIGFVEVPKGTAEPVRKNAETLCVQIIRRYFKTAAIKVTSLEEISDFGCKVDRVQISIDSDFQNCPVCGSPMIEDPKEKTISECINCSARTPTHRH